MVTRNSNGEYVVNGTVLSSYDAFDVYKFVKSEYNAEDIAMTIEEEYGAQTQEEVTANQELWRDILDMYEDCRNNDEQWHYDAEYVVSEFRSELDAIAANH